MRNKIFFLLMSFVCFSTSFGSQGGNGSCETIHTGAYLGDREIALQHYDPQRHKDDVMNIRYDKESKNLLIGVANKQSFAALINKSGQNLTTDEIKSVLQKFETAIQCAKNVRVVCMRDGSAGGAGLLQQHIIQQAVTAFNQSHPKDADVESSDYTPYTPVILLFVVCGGALVVIPGSVAMLNDVITSVIGGIGVAIGGIGVAIGGFGVAIGLGGALIPVAVPLCLLAAIIRGMKS